MSKPPNSMRQAMPTIASFVDEMRAAFCKTPAEVKEFNEMMIRGVRGEVDCFYAEENGKKVGTPFKKRWIAPALYVPPAKGKK